VFCIGVVVLFKTNIMFFPDVARSSIEIWIGCCCRARFSPRKRHVMIRIYTHNTHAHNNLTHTHENTSHSLYRDVKPENLLVVAVIHNAAVNCKLSDFGTATTVLDPYAPIQHDDCIGTPLYMVIYFRV
jgi:serine/threonine protein kinase